MASSSSSSLIPKQITFLKQAHFVPRFLDLKDERYSDILDTIFRSQFEVAQHILKNPDAIVIVENHTFDWSSAIFSDHKSLEMALFLTNTIKSKSEKEQNALLEDIAAIRVWGHKAKALFPTGFPKNLSSFTPEQKEFLLVRGGAETLFYLGQVSTLYRSINQKQFQQVEEKTISTKTTGKLAESEKTVVLDQRELAAFNWIKKAMEKTKKNKAILVFGGGHGFECIARDKSFIFNTIQTYSEIPSLRCKPVAIPATSSVHFPLPFCDLETVPNVCTTVYDVSRSTQSLFSSSSKSAEEFTVDLDTAVKHSSLLL